MALLQPATAADASAAAPAASSPAVPAPRNAGESVSRLGASESLVRTAMELLPQPAKWRELTRRVDAAEAAFEPIAPAAMSSGELVDLLGLSHDAWNLSADVAALMHDLTSLVRRLEHDGDALEADAEQWRESLPRMRERLVPEPVILRAQEVERGLRAAAERMREARNQALLELVRAQALQGRLYAASAQIATQMERIRAQRELLEVRPIWQLDAQGLHFARVANELDQGLRLLRGYLGREGLHLGLLFGSVFAACAWLLTRKPPAAAGAARDACRSPLAGSLLVALLALWWLAPQPPVIFYASLAAVVPIPVAIFARRSFAAEIPLTLYGLSLGTSLLAVRSLVEASALADRVLLLVQIVSLGVPVALDLRSGRLQRAFAPWSAEAVRAVAWLVVVVSFLSTLHAVFGLTGATRSLRIGTGSLVGFGLVFGTAALALYGVLVALLGTPLLGWLRSARAPDPGLLRALRIVLALSAAAGVAVVTLGNLNLVPAALAAIESFSGSSVDIGALSLSASAVGTALAIIVATLVFGTVTDFVLDREVFPRLALRPGAGYAIATFTRWSVFIVGGVLTLAALGLDTTKITVLAGALGVGIGFGLQNIVNNFVSGLILIVERPVAVGDLIEIGPLLGEIQRIGIRSSSVRTTHGAEVIVPNSDLASKEVINWTRSDRQRRYDIDVGVAYGSDPALVMRLLVEAAREVPEVMVEPAPMALFKGFGDSSLDFRLLAWVSTIDLGLQAQNALRIAVLARLEAAGVTMPFPQRDVHLITPPAPGAA